MDNPNGQSALLFFSMVALICVVGWVFIQLDNLLTRVLAWFGRWFNGTDPTDLTSLGSRERADLDIEAKAYAHDPRLLMVACMAKFSKVDGVVTKNELATVEAVFADLGLVGGQRPLAIDTFRLAKSGKATFHACVQLFIDQNRQAEEGLYLLLEVFFEIAHADGEPTARTRQALQDTCQWIGLDYQRCASVFREKQQSRQKQRAQHEEVKTSGVEPAYAVLGCKPTDSLAVIKDRYRKLVKDFHPDTVMSKGLPADFVKFAEERFKQIQAAYDTIMEAREPQRASV